MELSTCIQNRIGSNCVVNTDCGLVNNSLCLNGRCRCRDGFYVADYSSLCLQRTLGEECRVGWLFYIHIIYSLIHIIDMYILTDYNVLLT